jgi:hypothetical protein
MVCLLQYGVIAGGLADGSICLWDPAAILEGNTKAAMLAKMQKHTGVVSRQRPGQLPLTDPVI